ncbi:single-stranded DNA-binding protein [Dyadobacter pollutisoli]|uniref:Single-stranded DNA-binding protein n=1 Tax=Dyadobacter pollutisoli TaxID=2910158 RepID=A0A9E8SNZ7_9BACT|nr:single-stranded DNA-binding protein [Dyadobacter pollutisoli]WAC11327.1 single-stranded DNA-binding protein [Dyadobacter pollutisoli]
MNSVKLIGNVGRDISVKEFDGGRVVSFSLATNETYINKNKEEVKNTHWHTIVAWGQLAQRCETLVEKGKMVSVEGRLNYRQFQNKENQTVRVAEVVAFKVEEVIKNQEANVLQ